MPRARIAERAVALTASSPPRPYTCRSCLAHKARQISSSASTNAELPFFKRLKDRIFGTDDSKKLEEKRMVAREKVALEPVSDSVIHTPKGDYRMAKAVGKNANGYSPSMTWAGMERVGGAKFVKAQGDQGEQYSGYMPLKRGRKIDRRATAELLRYIAENAPIKVKEKDAPTLAAFKTSKHAQVQETAGFKKAMEMSLRNPEFKLKIVQQIMQVTGNRISDHLVSQSRTLGDLINAASTNEEPHRLSLTSEMRQSQRNLSNVKIHFRRQTPMQKDIQVGRWKIIEEELKARDLPVTGSRLPQAKEGLRR